MGVCMHACIFIWVSVCTHMSARRPCHWDGKVNRGIERVAAAVQEMRDFFESASVKAAIDLGVCVWTVFAADHSLERV